MDSKQVIVIRRDLKMRRGKEVAQGSHASMAWLSHRLGYLPIIAYVGIALGVSIIALSQIDKTFATFYMVLSFFIAFNTSYFMFSAVERHWLTFRFTKVCVQVDSEKELDEIVQKAKAKGVIVYTIIDSGKTEFGGVPTKTCCAVGPDKPHKIDEITGHLKLY